MGSISINLGYRPTSAEIRERAQALLQPAAPYRLLDISGITGWKRCWAVYERDAPPDQDAPERLIALIEFSVSGPWFTYKIVDESFGPNALDCPQRLLKAVADYAPPNESAAEWRRRALARHAQARAVRQLLGEILEDYPHSDPRLVVRGEVVRYQRARQSGRPRHAYRTADGEVWGLNAGTVDLEATEVIRAQPRHVGTLEEAREAADGLGRDAPGLLVGGPARDD
ncbi:MAG: hypothetical protein F4056_10565 [Chloroflexi bacterium]|nr:hypothetical protein [Gemmatimonadota bacterium]MYI83685.1 hypothetical protein [Chloroflexota bacterium]